MAFELPSGTNTWVPSPEASGQIVSYFRNPKMFRFNDYIAFRPATKMVGLYLEFSPDEGARIVTINDFDWPDGKERPNGFDNLHGFEFKEYATKRRDFPVTLGNLSIKQASWDIIASHSAMLMQQAATLLTLSAVTVLEDFTTTFAGFTSTATASAGGKWSAATTTNPYIMKSFNFAANTIRQNTNGMVTSDMLRCLISPTVARSIKESGELIDFLKQSPVAMAQVQGYVPNKNIDFGLPEQMYGIQICVENAVRVTTRRGGTQTRTDIKNAVDATFMSKQEVLPGDQVGDFPTPNFSTFQSFYYGEDGYKTDETGSGLFVAETWNDVRNKRTEAHVVTNTCEKAVSPRSGYILQAVL